MLDQIADHMNEIFPVLVTIFVVLPLCIGWPKASRRAISYFSPDLL
jgi:hypothetical protein